MPTDPSPHLRRSRRRRRLGALAALAALPLLAAGCESEAVAGIPLPLALAVRSDLPYVEGRIAAREEGAVLRVLVQAPARSERRVTAAYVTVPDGATLLWRDGSVATAADLRVGRAVVVWADGAELRSSPPQVAADAVLLER